MGSAVKHELSGDVPVPPRSTGRRYEAVLRLSEALSQCLRRSYTMSFPRRRFASVLLVLSWATFSFPSWTQTTEGPDPASTFAVGAQYDTTHVYVSPSDLNA